MKRALTIVFALAVLPLGADEPKATATDTPSTTKAPATANAAAPAQADSPLVAAAKRANRKGRKGGNTIVITNESLKTSGANAHVTTTATQSAIQMPKALEPPRPTPEMAAAREEQVRQKAVAEAAEKERKAKEERERKKYDAAAAHEEGYDGMQDDAAEVVGSNPPPPQF